jgi:hypothetical protein
VRAASGLIAVAAAAALALPSPGRPAAGVPRTISLLEIDTSFAGLGGYDASSHTLPSTGQGITFGATLYRWAGRKRGAAAGHLQAVCTVTSTGGALCQGELSLPSGTLSLAGEASFTGPSSLPIVGGTGAYAGASGVFDTRNIGGRRSNASSDVIHLSG